jgi:flagellar basal-body rod protein FlgB
MLERLTSSIDFQGQALSLRAERQRLIASNIANADTPGYLAQDMDFAQALRSATAPMGRAAMAASGAVTHPGHVPLGAGTAFGPSTLGLAGDGRGVFARPAQTNLDQNTVDMDRERATFADNSIKLEASLRFIGGSVRTMLDAIKGQ